MQLLNISSLTDDKLQDLIHKIPKMKHVSIITINNTLTKHRTYPHNSGPTVKLKMLSTIGTSDSAFVVIALSISLYCKYFKIELCT